MIAVLFALALQVATSDPPREPLHDVLDKRGHAIGIADSHGHLIDRYDRYGDLETEKPRCKGHYTEDVETRALTVLTRLLTTEGARFYDGAHPVVRLCRSKMELYYYGDVPRDGGSLLDPDTIRIDLDVCTHRVIGSRNLPAYGDVEGPPCA